MRRVTLVAGAGALALLGAACSALFGDSAQCSSDSDCTKFGDSVCGPEGTCVPANGALADGGGDATGTGDDGGAGDDAGGPGDDGGSIVCIPDAARPLEVMPGNPADAGAGKGVATQITTDAHLSCDKDWALAGTVIVRSGATLTIDKSVVIRAQAGSALVVQPGAKIVAVGTANEPIVITSAKAQGSRAPGDFKGVFVLGRATGGGTANLFGDPVYAYGGNAATDSSGRLKFVRIEYATNAIDFAGVGSGTEVDSLQARRTSDDAIIFTNGTVNAKHLAVQSPGDEGIYLLANYSGKLQYVIVQRTPTGPSHNGFMIEASKSTVYNATFCGTNVQTTPNQAIGLFAHANGRPDVHNAIVMGYAAGFDMQGDAGAGTQIATSQFFGQLVDPYAYAEDAAEPDAASPYFDDDNGFDEQAFLADPSRNNSTNDPNIARCFTPDNPGFAPATMLPGATPPNDGFFDVTATFRGAVKDATDTWPLAPWLVWATQ